MEEEKQAAANFSIRIESSSSAFKVKFKNSKGVLIFRAILKRDEMFPKRNKRANNE